jgi:hypothetical protein
MYTPAVTMVAAWIRALTGVRQPYIERKLRRLPCRADKEQERHRRQRGVAHFKMAGGNRRAEFGELNRAQRPQHEKQSQNEAGVADAVDNKRFLPRVRG